MNCDISHFSLSFGGKPACTMRRSGSPFGSAFVKKNAVALRAVVAQAELGKIRLAAFVVVVQIDEEGDDALAAFARSRPDSSGFAG